MLGNCANECVWCVLDGGSKSGAAAPVRPETKRWERAWSFKELREASTDWTLAADAGLLLYLQEFSQRIVKRTHKIETQVDALVNETKVGRSMALSTLSHGSLCTAPITLKSDSLCGAGYWHEIAQCVQFVPDAIEHSIHRKRESEQAARAAVAVHVMHANNGVFIPTDPQRVYEDDVADSQVKGKPEDAADVETRAGDRSNEERQAEIIPKFTKAIKAGLATLDTHFVKVEEEPPESDDELPDDYIPEMSLEPKDMYVDRVLPYVIGTPAFVEDDLCGLKEQVGQITTVVTGMLCMSLLRAFCWKPRYEV